MKAIRFMAVSVLLTLAACSRPATTEKAAAAPAVPAAMIFMVGVVLYLLRGVFTKDSKESAP